MIGAAGSLHSVKEHLSLLGPGMLSEVVVELMWRLDNVKMTLGGGWRKNRGGRAAIWGEFWSGFTLSSGFPEDRVSEWVSDESI